MSAPVETINNLYVLQGKLGQGGMGEVYKALHRLTGRVVALKRVRTADSHTESVDGDATEQQSSRQSLDSRLLLAEEFQTLSSLHHPHIVSVLDYGFDTQQNPYFTMELLQSPQTILEEGRDQPLLRKAELLVQLLQALAYLHRRGVLHRDIKPSNVLVEDGILKLLDFGIADAIDAPHSLAGTLEYMAPELFLGEGPSPASDLYAVGILAYELFANAFPHSVGSQTRFLEGVLGDASEMTLPPQVMELISARGFGTQVDDKLEEGYLEANLQALEESAGPLARIVTRLLERTRENRYQDAMQVIRDLSDTLEQHLPIETQETRESFLQAATFVGRDRELKQLLSLLKTAERGSGSLILVSGESGVGKSRLLHELRTRALVRSARVIRSQSQTVQGTSYQLWSTILRELVLYTEDLSPLDIGILRDLVPDIETLLERKGEKPPAAQPQAAQGRLRATIVKVLQLQRRLVVLLLEDLHWAEAESLELWNDMFEIIQDVPIMVIGNYREEEATEDLNKLKATQHIRLRRLDTEHISSLCASMLGEVGRQPALTEYLVQQTEGNVFFLIEVVRALAENAGQLGLVGEHPLPEHLLTGGIERLIERRLGKISPKEKHLLELAAVGGRQIDKQVLSHASAQADLSGWLMMCANASVLEVQGGTWLFAHDKVREVLLTHLDNGQRQQMHRQLAESITTVHLNDSSYDSALGHHWIQANVPEKSYKYFLKAGQAAARLYALKVARAHFSSALAALDRLPGSEERSREKFDILLQKISASQQSDRLDAYLAQTSAAETILNSLPLQGPNFQADQVRRSRLLFLKARGYFLNSDPSNSLACYRAAFNLASEHNDKMQMAALSGAIGCTLLLQGYVVKAQPFLREAINFFKGQKLILEAARLLGFLGVATVANGQVRKGREFIREAAASLSSDPAFSVSIFGFSGMNYFLLEDWKLLRDSAVSSLDNTLYTDELFVCSQFWWMAWAEACLGMHDKSTMHRRKAEEIFSKRQTVLTHDWLLVGDADMALRAGNAELAIERVEKAIEVAKNMDGVLALGLAHRVWARALAAKNRPDWDSAERHLSESIRFLESGALWLPVAHTRMTWGQLSAMRGDIANAIVQYKLAEALFARSEESSLVIKAQERLATLSTPSS